jgi:hypothetical protein
MRCSDEQGGVTYLEELTSVEVVRSEKSGTRIGRGLQRPF